MAEKTNFWSSTTIDPKRTFRWVLVFDHIPTYVITKVGKPNFTVSPVKHNYIAHEFKYPGRVTWEDVTVTLVDPVYPDASAKVVKMLQASGYAIPGTEENPTPIPIMTNEQPQAAAIQKYKEEMGAITNG